MVQPFFTFSPLEIKIMCGRFALKAPPRSIRNHFNLPETVALEPRYNIAPSQAVAVIRQMAGSKIRQLDMLRWGLIPSWAGDMKIGYKMINARAETLSQKPSFRSAFKKRRCLIPTDGFYEWLHAGNAKTPFFVHLANDDVFGFAGLWETWKSQEGDIIESCTIITTAPNDLVKGIHDRMPVIIHPDQYETWLEDSSGTDLLQQLLNPYPAAEMEMHRVGPAVNSPKNDTPDCSVSID